ncbi:MAG TPA: 50S ribosomal protein L11 methyltransferase [Rickettsia endosymbiont of Pyrocoelia pectoralis]|nr:50S ribosomal protein L11 methyltransferase [Rickettsia endosymbiont of Pyrocoelia pectoralis]
MFETNSQLKDIFKISFDIQYRDIDIFEEFFSEKASVTSVYEVKSETIEAELADIWRFEAYYSIKPNLLPIKEEMQKLAESNNTKIVSDIILEDIENKDWVALYQNQVSPIQTKNFFICTKLHQDKCPKDKSLILIEASRAFGTGSHETTYGCIEILEYIKDVKVNKILDIGTGSGILSFVAEKIWDEAAILACDIDEAAIEIAKENAHFNNSHVQFYRNNAEKILLNSYYDVKFDLIISNILASPLIELSSQIKELINDKGYLILSGFLDSQVRDVKNAYEKIGFKVKKTIHKNSWVILGLEFLVNNE